MNQNNLINFVVILVTICLAIILMSVVSVMLFALFTDKVDNDAIFKLIEPSFNMIVGAFVGLLGGLQLGKAVNEG
jgi:uncharacterized protein YqhQ